jgi:hypothetical protein
MPKPHKHRADTVCPDGASVTAYGSALPARCLQLCKVYARQPKDVSPSHAPVTACPYFNFSLARLISDAAEIRLAFSRCRGSLEGAAPGTPGAELPPSSDATIDGPSDPLYPDPES